MAFPRPGNVSPDSLRRAIMSDTCAGLNPLSRRISMSAVAGCVRCESLSRSMLPFGRQQSRWRSSMASVKISRADSRLEIERKTASEASLLISFSKGIRRLRIAFRRKALSLLVLSVTKFSLHAATYSSICRRDSSSKGRTTAPLRGRMEVSPTMPAPRRRFRKNVSTRSSIWCPTAIACAPSASARSANHR